MKQRIRFRCRKTNGKYACKRVGEKPTDKRGMGDSSSHWICKKDKHGKVKECKRTK